MAPAQLVLNFNHRPALTGDDFLVTPCNENAVSWIDRFPDWPSIAMVIHGPVGCGKSHLAQVFLAKSGAVNISSTDLLEKAPPALLDGFSACLLDDLDRAFEGNDKAELEVALLHLYNTALENGVSMMMTAATPPARWPLSLADLSSRLKTATVTQIGSPDDSLLAAVLVKQFADRQLKVDSDVVAFVQARIERSFDALGQFVDATDKLAMAEKRRITVPLARRVLQELNERKV
ncbi:MAG: DNA replication protein [Rhodospirillales bacterium]|nr:DNA replication protein [Rhodospirillales bacterium]